MTTRQRTWVAVMIATIIALCGGLLTWGIASQDRSWISDCNKYNFGGEVIEKLALGGCPRGEEYDPLR